MLSGLADTHTVVWYIFDDARLSAPAKEAIEEASRRGHTIGVSAISLAEMVYLTEKGRVPSEVLDRTLAALGSRDSVLCAVAFDHHIADAMRDVPRETVPELPDRIIAATALHYGVPVITRDLAIRATALTTIW